jgi:hypothetical protein
MSPTRIEAELKPIELDLAAAFSFEQGFGRAELLQLGARLDHVRAIVINAATGRAGENLALPQRLLAEYHQQRKASLLGRILTLAKDMREAVDAMVILGPPQMILVAKALLAGCGHPHHNDLSRGQRGGRPRIYFAPAVPDNDALQALLDILPHGRILRTVDERWGLLTMDESAEETDSGSSHDSAQLLIGLFSLLWDRLQSTTTAAEEARLAAFVGPRNSPLAALAEQIGLPRIETEASLPSTSGATNGRGFLESLCDYFHPGVLLAASVIGLDVVKFLHGAAAIWQRFAGAPVGNNAALDLGGLCHLLSARFGNDCYTIESTAALRPLAEIIFCHSCHTPRSAPLLIQWLPQASRADRLSVKMAGSSDSADRKNCKERTLNDLAAETAETLRTARTEAGKFTAVVKISLVDEASVGQLIQLHNIAATVAYTLSTHSPPGKAGG